MLRLIVWRPFLLMWVAILVVGCGNQDSSNRVAAVEQPEPMNPPGASLHDGGERLDVVDESRLGLHAGEAGASGADAGPAADPSAAPMDARFAGGANRDMDRMAESLRRNSREMQNQAIGGGRARAGAPMAQPNPGQPAPAPEPQVDGERHENYGENPWTVAGKDALSTFAIDVDTAAYTLMRNDVLQNGRLPAKDGVRVEEYLNYFDYDYAAPEAGSTPFAIHMETAPSPFAENRQLVRVGIQGYEVPAAERKPANLVFLIDVSGSMSSANKLPLVQYALKQLVDKLNPTDTLGIVVYAGHQAVLLEPTAVQEKSRILNILDGLRSGGSTAGAAGITTAYELAQKAFRQDGINRVVLCTDGDFNVGARGNDLIELVAGMREQGISLSTFLFGRGNINDRDMEQIANQGNGNYAYIDTQNEALRALGDKVVGMLQVIAKDVKIQVEFDPATVAKYRLIGYENRAIADEDFRNDKVDAGELGAGHSVTALYEIELAGGAAADAQIPAQQPAVIARLRYKKPGAKAEDPAAEVSQALTRGQLLGGGSFDDASADFRFASAVAWFGQIMKRSQNVERAAMDRLIEIAEQTAGDRSDRREFLQIAIKASDMPQLYEPVASEGTTDDGGANN